jgi:hypothetical protein
VVHFEVQRELRGLEHTQLMDSYTMRAQRRLIPDSGLIDIIPSDGQAACNKFFQIQVDIQSFEMH